MEKIPRYRSLSTATDSDDLPPMMEPNHGQSQEPREVKSGFRNRNNFEKTAAEIELDRSLRETGEEEAA
jgi:hypothetical protein